ncbi:MAG: polysaccharide deacetylase family protein [Clostridia bacterium]|nr:polysaccharide deacetylase family protein [Clostridia bacterium]
MFHGKMKAVTFSFDDGVQDDKIMIKMLDKYGLKGTFNINTGRMGLVRRQPDPRFTTPNHDADHSEIAAEEIKEVYKNHEVAVHTVSHARLPKATDEEVIRQVEEDRKTIESLVGYDVVGMAYPYGDVDDRVAKLIAENTPIWYGRAIPDTSDFYDLQADNLLQYRPTVHFSKPDVLFPLAEKFLAEKNPEKPMLLYVWGHTYEAEGYEYWDKFEEFCKMISGKDDTFYGTNREVFECIRNAK